MIIDLHCHTRRYSHDSDLDPGELIEKAKRSGLDGICFTEHDYFWKEADIAQLSHEYDFPIFPGVEVNTEEGHLLVFGLSGYKFGMHHASFVRSMVDAVNGAIIMAHPYRGRIYDSFFSGDLLDRASKNKIFEMVDAVEILNGRGNAKEISFSQAICRRLGLKGVWGSDAHSQSDIPSCATLFERKVTNINELVTELRTGRCKAVDLRQPTQAQK